MRRLLGLLILLAVMFCSCDSAETETKEDDIAKSDLNSNFADDASNSLSKYVMATASQVMVYGSGNDNGFYEVYLNDDSSMNLMYTDYASANQIYLCSRSNCSHCDETCSSWIAPYGGMVFPVAMNDNLALVYCSTGLANNSDCSKVEIMSADGGSRKTVYTFSDDVKVYVGAATDNENIVIRTTKTETTSKGINVIYSLIKINVFTGEVSEIYSTVKQYNELQKSMFLLGVCDYGFIVKTITVNSYDECGDADTQFENMRRATVHDVYLLPYEDTQNAVILLSFLQDEVYEEPYKNSIVFLKNNNGKYSLNVLNIENMNETVLVDDFDSTEVENNINARDFDDTFIYGFVDDYVLLNHMYDDHYLEDMSIEMLYTQYAVNLSTGQMKEIELSNYYLVTRHPIEILAQFPGHLLVHAFANEADGVVTKHMGIISVSDFLNSQESYNMINQIKTVQSKLSK